MYFSSYCNVNCDFINQSFKKLWSIRIDFVCLNNIRSFLRKIVCVVSIESAHKGNTQDCIAYNRLLRIFPRTSNERVSIELHLVFSRKSICGNWKANIGANVLEKVPMNDRFRAWIDECAQLFGGLDVCAVEAVHGKDGLPYIIDLAGSCMPLLGESQEEDRRLIADLVFAKMQQLPKSNAAS